MTKRSINEFSLHECFSRIEKSDMTGGQVVTYLRDQSNFILRTVLQGGYSKELVFDLPEGSPEYVRDVNPIGYSASRISNVCSNLPRFLKNRRTASIPPARKHRRFIEILESVPAAEADILILMKDKKIHTKYSRLTPDVVFSAFPGLFKSDRKNVIGEVGAETVKETVAETVAEPGNEVKSQPTKKRARGRPKKVKTESDS
jgi:hypothetical protein